ncbi:MAG: NAD-dependent epimerase/dehydratase family protein [Actinobacteria bacterium]|nr:NAD-dependent epimerase/dehydratase family protein [Actinomycetota bacterium]
MSRSVLVTGGAGFIGSHLVAGLLRWGDRVRVLDDLSAGTLDNLVDCIDDVEVLVGDVRDTGVVERALAGVDAVAHLAAIVSVARSFDELELVDDVNVGGSLTVLAAARRLGVGRVVCASSAAVYGDVEALPVGESAPLRPLSPYGVGKLAVEGYARAVVAQEGSSVVCLRFFNVYGPRQDPSSDYAGVIARFLACAAERRPFTVFGDGDQTRDFVYVGDIVRATMLALDVDLQAAHTLGGAPSSGAAGGAAAASDASAGIAADHAGTGSFAVCNVGSGRETSVLDLAAAVARVTASGQAGAGGSPVPPSIHFETARPGDIRRSLADIGAAGSLLGYRPTVSLDTGLATTWEWWRAPGEPATPAL